MDPQLKELPRLQESQSGSLIESILQTAPIARSEDGYDAAAVGLRWLISQLLDPTAEKAKIDKTLVDAYIAKLDERISEQMDEILHSPAFQAVESAWRGLKFSVDRADFRENIRIEVLHCQKEELIDDFGDATSLQESGLYKLVYASGIGMYNGIPVGAIFSNYTFGPSGRDIALLRSAAAVSAMAHAPFFGSAGPQFFEAKDYLGLPNKNDLVAPFETPAFTNWRAFRETEDARYVGLVLPRFLLRLPYGGDARAKSFNYQECVGGDHENYLWGNTTFAFASRLTESFAKYRWCPNIIGPEAGGTVDNLPLHQFEAMGELQTKLPTEIAVPLQNELELSELGFIPFVFKQDSSEACFFSAASAQKPKFFGQSKEGRDAEFNYRLGTQLPYLFIVSRLAHYIKAIQVRELGKNNDRSDIEAELNRWIGQYVVDHENPTPSVYVKRPLRSAEIEVKEIEGTAGWYQVAIRVRPHVKYQGASFTLSLVGKLKGDK